MSAIKTVPVTTTNQFTTIDRLGLDRGDTLGMFSGKQVTATELHDVKDTFKRDVNPSGEVPAIALPSGDVVIESEIVCEYLDASSMRETPHLVPADPFAAAQVRLAMKRFNAVPPAIVTLLKNQDDTQDEALTAQLDAAIETFVAVIDGAADASAPAFCFGKHCTLTDVHAAPFIFRFSVVLGHYRGYRMTQRHPRLESLLLAVEVLPEWQRCLDPADGSYPAVTSERLVALYAAYANNGVWKNDGPTGTILAGRGAVQMICCQHEKVK